MENISKEVIEKNKKYLKLLSKDYPDVSSAVEEIVNLKAILALPKGTEHFLTDIHGEDEAFNHVMQNASGVVARKINDELSSTVSKKDLEELKTLIYYPKEKLELIKKQTDEDCLDNWYKLTIYRLVKICRAAASKYTRSKVRKGLPKQFAYIMEELLQEDEHRPNKKDYYNQIINTLVDYKEADEFIIGISETIKKFTIDHLHIIGDIFDRGPGPDKVMDTLMKHHSIDIQWGNHDILWMGAAAGNEACICNVIRIALRYANNDVLENGYGINLLPLATFAQRTYNEEGLKPFYPKNIENQKTLESDIKLISKMHKAISIIQFKVEEKIIDRHKEYDMDHRKILSTIDLESLTVRAYGKTYKLNCNDFPTIDQKNPAKLTEEERSLLDKLVLSFKGSNRLQNHIRFLYSQGSMYKTYNDKLLFHACVMLNEDKTFKEIDIKGKKYSGKEHLDITDRMAREAYYESQKSPEKSDFLWYLWCNQDSPLFGKDKMATFERYFLEEAEPKKENLSPYFHLMKEDDGTLATKILAEFGLEGPDTHIINGHTPVKTKKGEKPVRAGGKLFVIDGGFSRAYQKTTGIAGYTLTFNSYGLTLIHHEPFESVEKVINEGFDIKSNKDIVEHASKRLMVADTDNGKLLMKNIEDLEMLIVAYKKGLIKQIH